MKQEDDFGLRRHLWQLVRLLFLQSKSALEPLGLYPGQPALLHALREHGGISQKAIADFLMVKPATVAVMIKRMEKTGYIERLENPKDKRQIQVFLTPRGEEVEILLRKKEKEEEKQCFSNFTPEEKVIMRRLCMQICENLIQYTIPKDRTEADTTKEDITKC